MLVLSRILVRVLTFSLVMTSSHLVLAQDAEESDKNQATHKLTDIGAKAAGNKENTIPAYTGEKIITPLGWKVGQHYTDPFMNDEVQFRISSENLSKHENKLALGQKLLLQRNNGYNLPIYQTRRTATYPKYILDGTRDNAKSARLTSEGAGLINFKQGFPFPKLDKNSQTAALQSIWNHIARYRGGNVERTVVQATVFDSGDFVPVKLYQRYTRTEHLKSKPKIEKGNVLFYYLDKIISPARLSGTTLLVHETLDQTKEYRRAWLYNQAYKRVYRTPGAAYDTPIPGTYGLKTADSHDMYNGSPDKYQWQYQGKQELYIPYNAYQIASNNLTYDDLLKSSTINTDHTRWELHRVHKIEATLKTGQRHIYAKRIFYLDEDSWTIVLAELYDNRGELWRVSEGHLINYYDMDLPYFAMEVTYDLFSNRYNVFGLSNEESQSYTFNKVFKLNDYTPSALRRNSRG